MNVNDIATLGRFIRDKDQAALDSFLFFLMMDDNDVTAEDIELAMLSIIDLAPHDVQHFWLGTVCPCCFDAGGLN